MAYNVYRGATKVASEITDKTFEDTGLTASTAYKYKVEDTVTLLVSDILDVTTKAPTVIPVTSVAVAPKNATGTTGTASTKQFTATVLPATATNKTVSWTIAPTTTGVTINSSGLVSWTDAVAPVTLTITGKDSTGTVSDTGSLVLSAP